MPLSGHIRCQRRQIIEPGQYLISWQDHPIGADRTAIASNPSTDGSLPLMPLLTDPPDPFVAASRYHLGCQRAVSRAPLFRQAGMGLNQRSIASPLPAGGYRDVRQRGIAPVLFFIYLAGADWAAGTAASAGMYRCLLLMSLFTSPPGFLLAAPGNAIRRQRQIPFCHPLCQQCGVVGSQAILLQCFPQ